MADLRRIVTCDFCGKVVELDRAVAGGWVPYFYRDDREQDNPACPACAVKHLHLGDDGEWDVVSPTIIV